MNSRERVLRTLNYQEPDRVPIELGATTATSIHVNAHGALKEHLGFSGGEEIIKDWMQHIVEPDERILRKWDMDFRGSDLGTSRPWIVHEDGSRTNEWGVTYVPSPDGLYHDPRINPLAELSLEDSESYPWPDPLAPERFAGLAEKVRDLHENSPYAVVMGGFTESFFGLPTWLCGAERWYPAFILEPKFINALLDILEAYWLKVAEKALSLAGKGIDVVRMADDLGTQLNTIISPAAYREFIKPRQARLYRYVKEHCDAKVFFHSCGSIYHIIEDLIEIGVDALNPVQVGAANMDAKQLKAEFGGRITFWGGGVNTQTTLPFGTPEEVEAEVKGRIEDFAPGGGFVFTQVHNIQPDCRPENIAAMYDAVHKYGGYPIGM